MCTYVISSSRVQQVWRLLRKKSAVVRNWRIEKLLSPSPVAHALEIPNVFLMWRLRRFCHLVFFDINVLSATTILLITRISK